MDQSRKIAVVVNPRSAGGKTGRRWSEIQRKLEGALGPLTARFTDAPGAGIALARGLLLEGFDFIIAAGGDGTANEVANGFIDHDQPLRPGALLGILPLGTGGDFRRSLDVSTDLDAAIKVLAAGAPVEIDIGKATFHSHNGNPVTRYFVNLVSFGMGGDVAARSRNFLSPLGGKIAFLWATFTSFARYRGSRVRLRLDGVAEQNYFIINAAIGNGRFHGGGMRPCPTALLNDGILEVTVIDYLNAFELARDIHVLYSENVYQHPKAHHLRAQEVSAVADGVAKIEIDGEPLGRLPLEVKILPKKLWVAVPAGSPLIGPPTAGGTSKKGQPGSLQATQADTRARGRGLLPGSGYSSSPSRSSRSQRP